ncbi:hypothetical protein OG756_03580 [Streptomyces sp. NBC_01310]|uniref:hypothetical protein n=1 Tax=Streptomyces sp. NBC_01310 TaxID=2903820 RepID=UPI0035B5782A|nr:hypothetical protein OG756_03580 [Streptomyces sp. NBC_01310]
MTGHRPLLCRGCSGHLYAVCTVDHAGGNVVGQWEVDHETTPVPCPLAGLLPLTGTAASVHDLPGAEEVLGPQR